MSSYTDITTEEEKKVIAPLLGKLYVSPASSEEKIRELYDEVSAAVDDKLLADATSRNALYKIHVSLGKIVNTLGEQDTGVRVGSRSVSVTASVDERASEDAEDRTVLPEPQIKEEDEDSEGTVIHRDDTLVDELLSDGEGA
jgi:condensin complex subunit 3